MNEIYYYPMHIPGVALAKTLSFYKSELLIITNDNKSNNVFEHNLKQNKSYLQSISEIIRRKEIKIFNIVKLNTKDLIFTPKYFLLINHNQINNRNGLFSSLSNIILCLEISIEEENLLSSLKDHITLDLIKTSLGYPYSDLSRPSFNEEFKMFFNKT